MPRTKSRQEQVKKQWDDYFSRMQVLSEWEKKKYAGKYKLIPDALELLDISTDELFRSNEHSASGLSRPDLNNIDDALCSINKTEHVVENVPHTVVTKKDTVQNCSNYEQDPDDPTLVEMSISFTLSEYSDAESASTDILDKLVWSRKTSNIKCINEQKIDDAAQCSETAEIDILDKTECYYRKRRLFEVMLGNKSVVIDTLNKSVVLNNTRDATINTVPMSRPIDNKHTRRTFKSRMNIANSTQLSLSAKVISKRKSDVSMPSKYMKESPNKNLSFQYFHEENTKTQDPPNKSKKMTTRSMSRKEKINNLAMKANKENVFNLPTELTKRNDLDITAKAYKSSGKKEKSLLPEFNSTFRNSNLNRQINYWMATTKPPVLCDKDNNLHLSNTGTKNNNYTNLNPKQNKTYCELQTSRFKKSNNTIKYNNTNKINLTSSEVQKDKRRSTDEINVANITTCSKTTVTEKLNVKTSYSEKNITKKIDAITKTNKYKISKKRNISSLSKEKP